LKEKNLPADSYVSENDDTFLYVLLGLKEHANTSTKGPSRQRKVGRGKQGRFGKGKGKSKPSRPRDGSGRTETLRSFKALDKKEVSKLKPEDERHLNDETRKPGMPKASQASSFKTSKVDPSSKNKNNKGNNDYNNKDKKSSKPGVKQNESGKKGRNDKKSTKTANTQRQISQTPPTMNYTQQQIQSQPSIAQDQQRFAPQNNQLYPSAAQQDPKVELQQVPRNRQPLQSQSRYFSQYQGQSAEQKQYFPPQGYPQGQRVTPQGQYQSQQFIPQGQYQSQYQDQSLINNAAVSNDSLSPIQGPDSKLKAKTKAPVNKPPKKVDPRHATDAIAEKLIDLKISSPSPKTKSPSKSANGKPAKKSDKLAKGKAANKPEPSKPKSKANIKESTPVIESKPDKNFLKSVPEDEQREEYEHIPKYLANQPKLSYSSLDDYLKEMCYHLYLEEKLETKAIVDFTTEYSQDNKRLVKVNIPYTEEVEKMVPEKFRKLGKLPFSINQGVFISRSSDKDNIWECFVKDLNVITKRGKKIELLLEIYKWNNVETFPVGSVTLSLLPSSATISRILFAMGRIENPKFIKMLLGNESIKQISFKNFLNFTKDTFNDSQKSAIQHVLNNSITVLQGPPGTGKTSTIYEIILQLLRNLRTFPILVVAASNIAIDNIAEKLKNDKDLTILRIVSNEKNREYNEHHHLSDICLHHKVFDMLPQRFKETSLDLRYNRPVSKNQYKKFLTMANTISDKLISQAQVILTTTVVAGGFQLKSIKKLPVVIMDESTQSSEASTLIPLSMPGVDKFIFVGDDKQLSSFSDIPYLEQSLFERVLRNGTYTKPHMLNVQYRMNPKISAFPIKNFYSNLLTDGVTSEQRTIEGIEPLQFVDHKGQFKESKVSNYRRGGSGGYTYTNNGETELILRILKHLILDKTIKNANISIITPYSAQRDLIATTIQQDPVINPESKSIEEEVDEDSLTSKKPTTIKTIVDIMVSSIDAFQGREKDIIIFSCVRSNSENNIGFVKDPRRLNVALTRARCGLVLVGDGTTMAKGDALWKHLMGHLTEEKMVVSAEEYFK
jgi:hypothetical protein